MGMVRFACSILELVGRERETLGQDPAVGSVQVGVHWGPWASVVPAVCGEHWQEEGCVDQGRRPGPATLLGPTHPLPARGCGPAAGWTSGR